MTRVKRRRQEVHTEIVVVGGSKPDHKVPSIEAGIALALDRASRCTEGTKVFVTEYGEIIGAAIRGEVATQWWGAAFLT